MGNVSYPTVVEKEIRLVQAQKAHLQAQLLEVEARLVRLYWAWEAVIEELEDRREE